MPTIAVTEAFPTPPEIIIPATNIGGINSGVTGSIITPSPTKNPTQKPTDVSRNDDLLILFIPIQSIDI